MSESQARHIVNQKGMAWQNEGKSLFKDWRALERSEGRNPDEQSISSFDKYLCGRISSGTIYKDLKKKNKPSMKKQEDVSINQTSTFESMIGQSQLESPKELKGEDSNDTKVFRDQLRKIDESYESESLMSFAKSISKENKTKKVPSLNRKYTKDKSFKEDDFTHEDNDKNISENIMMDSILSESIQNMMDASIKPVSNLHMIISKSGQQKLKDMINEHLNNFRSKGNDSEENTSEDEFSESDIKNKNGKEDKKGSFLPIKNKKDPNLKSLSSFYMILCHAEKDDSISSKVSKEASLSFNEILDMSKAISCIDKEDMNSDGSRSHFFNMNQLSDPDNFKSISSKGRNISKFDSYDIDALELNYKFAQSTAFGSWGQSSLRKEPESLNQEANKLASSVLKWLASNKKDGGAKYDDASNGIYLGYQSTVAFLTGIISLLPENFKETNTNRRGLSNVAFNAIQSIRRSFESKLFPTELLDYEKPGETESKSKRGRKAKKLGRRGLSKAFGIISKRELSIIKSLVKECSVAYGRLLAKERQTMASQGSPSGKIDKEKRMEISLEVLTSFADKEARKAAKKIGRMAFSKATTIRSSRFDVYDMTIKAIALTVSHMATQGYGSYQPRNNNPVRINILNYVVEMAQRRVASNSDMTFVSFDANVLVGSKLEKTLPSDKNEPASSKSEKTLPSDKKEPSSSKSEKSLPSNKNESLLSKDKETLISDKNNSSSSSSYKSKKPFVFDRNDAEPSYLVLSNKEHDALVEACYSLKNYISQKELQSGKKRSRNSPPLSFFLVIPNEKKLKNENDRNLVYKNINRYIFEIHDQDNQIVKSIFEGKDPHPNLKVSGPIRLLGKAGEKLDSWIDRKNVHVHVRMSIC